MSWLSVSGISVREQGGFALREISFTQARLQKLAIAGETGAGKSTLLQVIAGLVQPTAGTVRFEDGRVRGPAEKLVPGQPGVAYLSQHFELPKSLRVEQVLRYASQRPAAEAAAMYEVCRISHLLTRQTNQLSGGERQRIALARLLLAAPRLLLLDEPFSNLDRAHRNVLKAVIHDAGDQLGITCLLVSHDPADTLSWADEILVLKAGQLIQAGPPARIYQQPVDEYTAGLFGDYSLVTGPLAGALAGGRQKGTRLLTRPESFALGAEAAGGLPGTVAEVRFFGSYSTLEVALPGGKVTVKTSVPGIVAGDTVYVSLAAAGVWLG
ncbi:MAG: ABC transporter ATP-binding protein [Hymenobacter sp.]|nr:ABC transporter ATP-binding protein [Hymenobacter sp.]